MEKSRKADNNESACILTIHVVPRSSRIAILYQPPDTLKVKLTAPPIEGAANQQLIEVLAKNFSIPRRNVEIISGAQSKTKRVRIHGISEAEVMKIVYGH